MPKRVWSLVVFGAIWILAACGGSPDQPPSTHTGDAENGKVLFSQPTMAGGPGCTTCHALELNKVVVGPSLAGIGSRASEVIQRPAYRGNASSAAEYLREAVTDPDIYVETGFTPGVMPKTYQNLAAPEVDDLVAYLLTLK
jgi:nitric oxide reductase subunit C